MKHKSLILFSSFLVLSISPIVFAQEQSNSIPSIEPIEVKTESTSSTTTSTQITETDASIKTVGIIDVAEDTVSTASKWNQSEDGQWYKVVDGSQLINTWHYDYEYKSWFYFNESGFIKIGWFYDYNYKSWYYFTSGGYMKKGWLYDNQYKSWFYFKESGSMATGWAFDKEYKNWFYFNSNGTLKKGWHYDAKYGWFYFKSNGEMALDLLEIKGKTYYFAKDGVMRTGEQIIEDKVYTFNNDGALIKIEEKQTEQSEENQNDETSTNEDNSSTENKKRDGWTIVDGKRFFFNKRGEQIGDESAKKVIDVSHWNGVVDWETAIRENDIDGVIVSLGYSYNGEDRQLGNNIRELTRLNIPYGVYLYTYASDAEEARLEAEFTIKLMKKYNIQPTYPIYYDVENWEYQDKSKRAPDDTQTWVNIVNAYMDTMNRNGYHNVEVYSYRHLLQTRLNHPDILKHVSWVAAYTDALDYENPYYSGPKGWQYTSSAPMKGIKGIAKTVDVSVWY